MRISMNTSDFIWNYQWIRVLIHGINEEKYFLAQQGRFFFQSTHSHPILCITSTEARKHLRCIHGPSVLLERHIISSVLVVKFCLSTTPRCVYRRTCTRVCMWVYFKKKSWTPPRGSACKQPHLRPLRLIAKTHREESKLTLFLNNNQWSIFVFMLRSDCVRAHLGLFEMGTRLKGLCKANKLHTKSW